MQNLYFQISVNPTNFKIQHNFKINLFILFLEELAVEASEQAAQEWYTGIRDHHP